MIAMMQSTDPGPRTTTAVRIGAGLAAAALAGLSVTGPGTPGPDRPGEGPVRLTFWRHDGQPAERAGFADQIRRFERSRPGVRVSVVQVPEAEYPDRVQLAALRSELPDILDVDGPVLANYAYQGVLAPLDELVADRTREDLTPSTRRQGTLDGHLYGVGAIDSGLGLFASRRALRAVGARIPRSWSDAWTAREFDAVLSRLAHRDRDGRVLDLALDYGVGEWFTYAFAPVVWSAGGTFGDPPTFSTARRTLPTPGTVEAVRRLARWATTYTDHHGDDRAAFTGGRVALSCAGHWRYRLYHAALGDDLVVLPLPDFGRGARTTSGSWAWAIAATSQHPREAAELLDFLLSTSEVLAASAASGGPPGTSSASLLSPAYRPGGPPSPRTSPWKPAASTGEAGTRTGTPWRFSSSRPPMSTGPGRTRPCTDCPNGDGGKRPSPPGRSA
jgi:multiple sugar transport system substrate-binding protein